MGFLVKGPEAGRDSVPAEAASGNVNRRAPNPPRTEKGSPIKTIRNEFRSSHFRRLLLEPPSEATASLSQKCE